MFRILVAPILAVALIAVASDAWAGGSGGAKRPATIRVTNNTTSGAARLGVILNKTETQLRQIADSSDPARAFTSAGGKFIEAGATASFSVQAGSHTIIAVDASENPQEIGTVTKSVSRGATVTVLTNSFVSYPVVVR